MRIVFFVHSLLSDWNHGNAHFLRGVGAELQARGHDVRFFEPRDAWSLQNLLTDHGEAALAGFRAAYPTLQSNRYDLATLDLDETLDGVEPRHRPRVERPRPGAAHRRRAADPPRPTGCSSTTPTTAPSPPPSRWRPTTFRTTTACWPSATSSASLYLERGWASRAWTWHEAADTRLFHPLRG